MNRTPGTATSGNGGDLDPHQAAALLDQATQHARSTFTPGTPALFAFRAVAALVIGGGFWLSVRGQDPYTGPTGPALPVAFALVAINIGWSARALRRAGSGIRGPAQRKRQAGIGLMLAAWVVAYAVMAPLYHAGASYPVWGLYPASGPLLIVGLAGAVITVALLRDWRGAGTCLAIAILGAAAGFVGPADAWLIMGIGLCAVCLGYAALTASRRDRSVIWP
jgi:hypothetical protein